MLNKIIFLFLISVTANNVYTQSISDTNIVTAKPLYVDSVFIKTIDTTGNIKLIQYYHPTKTYKGRRMFLGKDKYLLSSGELIMSARNYYEEEVTIAYGFYEFGQVRKIITCQLEGDCDLIYFHENGKVKSQYSVNSEGLNSGLWLKFDSEGKLIEKRLYSEDGKRIDE